MLNRVVKYLRPVVCRFNTCSKLSSKRNLPITTPWRSHGIRDDFFREPTFPSFWRGSGFHLKDLENQFEDMMRQMEKMMSPRTFDAYYIRPRYFEETIGKSEVAQFYEMPPCGPIFDHKLPTFYVNGCRLHKIARRVVRNAKLNVKLEGDRLIVSGKHEQKEDEHGYVSREFTREFLVPEDVNLETLKSSITEDGVLTVWAEVKGSEKTPEKVIEIQIEGKSTKENNKEKPKSD